jgi:DNA-binding NtrC family response regulator
MVQNENSKGRILFVEDSAILALDAEYSLREAGYEVIGPVYSVKDAFAKLANDNFDAALLDVILGGINITPFACALKKRNIPFAFCTGYDTEVVLDAGFEATNCLVKPFTCETLVKMADQLLVMGNKGT